VDSGTWASPVSDDSAASYLRQHPNREQASLSDPFAATAQTVRYMCRLVRHSLSDPVVWRAWEDAARRFGGIAGSVPGAAWWYAKTLLKFVHHQRLLESWLGKSDELQLLISPEALLKMRDPKGDCAVFTTLICALLDAAGQQWEIVTAAVNPYQPDVFSHVYPRAVLEDGRRLTLDASHGQYPGWEVPVERITRKQVWNSAGEPIEDLDSGYRGLHGVNDMGLGCGCGSKLLPLQSLAGLGCDPGWDAGCDSTVDMLPVNYGGSDQIYATTGGGSPDYTTNSSGSGSSFGSDFAASLANAWTKIAGNVIAPQTTYVRDPKTGALMLSTPASQTAAAAALVGGNTLGTGTSSLMPILIGGAALVAVLMMAKK